MEKSGGLKEEHEEPKVPPGDAPAGDAKSPSAEAGPAGPQRAEERAVSFNLGDAEEAPERLPSVDLKETNVDGGERRRGAAAGLRCGCGWALSASSSRRSRSVAQR